MLGELLLFLPLAAPAMDVIRELVLMGPLGLASELFFPDDANSPQLVAPDNHHSRDTALLFR